MVTELDMHYLGQTHTVAARLPAGTGLRRRAGNGGGGARGLRDGVRRGVQPGSCRASRSGSSPLRTCRDRPAADLSTLAALRTGARRVRRGRLARGTRPVWFDGAWREAAIYARLELPVGATIPGPAILEATPDATTVVDPGLVAPGGRASAKPDRREAKPSR